MADQTFVLTDVESSTALWERYPDQMSEAIVIHERIIVDAVSRSGGEIVRSRGEGDSLFAVFDSPLAAVEAAASFGRSLAATQWTEEAPIRTRVAVYTGEAEARDGDYYGTTVNRAARVRSLAFGGQILLGEDTAAMVRDRLPPRTALVDLGPRQLKDLAVAERVFELALIDADLPPDPLSDADASNDLWIERQLSSGFVDRDAEREQLVRAWDSAVAGERVLALVEGESGIGKTTLAAAIARHAQRSNDGIVLYGRWDEDVIASFQALREALGTYARACPRSVLRADLRGVADEIARLLPDVVKRAGESPPPPNGVVEAERLRLFEALDVWLSAIASRRPLCLVLDDLQWADRSSLLLLMHLIRSPLKAPLFVLATYRRDVDPPGELLRFVPGLAREANVHRVSLAGLERRDIVDLMGRFGGPGGAEAAKLARELHRETDGNPLFVREMVLHLSEQSSLRPAESRRLDLPESVRELVRWRLLPLTQEAREALAIAAVVGQEFDPDVVSGALGVSSESLMEALEESCRAGILHEGDSGERYAFSHAVVRKALLEDLTGARRSRYHWRIGDFLEQRSIPVEPSELAYHFCAAVTAERADKAISYARAAAGRAMDELAFETAIRHFERAIEIQSSHRPNDGGLRTELLLALGAALDRAGEYDKRGETFVAAADEARKLDRTDLFTRAAIGYRGVLPAATQLDPRGLALLEEALERLGPEPSRFRALVLGRLAHSLQLQPPRARRAALADEAVRIARGLGDQGVLAEALSYRCWALDGPDDMKDQLAAAEEIRALADALGRRELILRSLHLRTDALFEAGDFEALHRALDEMAELGAELRYPEYTRITRAWDAVFAVIEGRYEDAEEIAEDVRQQLIRMAHPQQELVYRGLLHPIAWLRGEMAAQLPIYEAILAAMPEQLLGRMLVAWVSAEAGMLDRSRETLTEIPYEAAITLDKNFPWWATIVGLVSATSLVGDREWAERLYEIVLPYADRIAVSGSTSFLGSARYHLAVLATTLERYDDAIEHFEAAVEKHRELNARPLLALTEISFSKMLAARRRPGDEEQAQDLRASALAVADELGLGAVTYRASLDAPQT
ncbi:MAG TPA: AAA family ATPase [Actinomycetota bacterium]|jgi:class 3 adenylate cyclase/tetratricopeptide (TPR) repeat protein|nr:AAA family ATPase [Actinomycetota bacterium]